MVCEDVNKNFEFGIYSLASKGEAPMADVVSVGAIGAGDLMRLGPSDDTSGGRTHDLLFFILL